LILKNATPEVYRDWVTKASLAARDLPGDDSLVFVNAWNEWAEGAHLEPDLRWGHAFLEAHLAGRQAAADSPPA
jgi:lipopolysaccharide biosynthesis protein